MAHFRTILIGWPYFVRLYQDRSGKVSGIVWRANRLNGQGPRQSIVWAHADIIIGRSATRVEELLIDRKRGARQNASIPAHHNADTTARDGSNEELPQETPLKSEGDRSG